MALGRSAYFSIEDSGGTTLRNISPYVNNTDVERSQDVLDTTTYGQVGHTFVASLTNGRITVSGLWDDTASVGTRTVFKSLIGLSTTVGFEWGPEGNANGAEKVSGECVVESYTESAPVADLVTFQAVIQISGTVTNGTFSA